MPTLIVEDGSVVANANAFVSLATADTYHSLRGNAAWTGTDAAKEAAIIKATFYLDRLHWKGLKTGVNNPLAWPRYGDDITGWNGLLHPATPYMGIIDEDGYDVGTAVVPAKVKDACCEMALQYLTGANPEPALDRGGKVLSQTIDVISTTYESGAPVVPVYVAVQRLLRSFLRANVGNKIVLG